MTTSISVEHVARTSENGLAEESSDVHRMLMEIRNSRTPTECTNNVLAFKDSDIYLQNIKLQKYFVHTYEPKIKVSILLKKSSTNFMLNSLGLFSLPYTISFKFTHRLRLQ